MCFRAFICSEENKPKRMQWMISKSKLWQWEVSRAICCIIQDHCWRILHPLCVCVWAYCLLQNVSPDWGYLIAAVTMAAAAHVMRERVRETGDLVKVQFKESHCSTKGTQWDRQKHKFRAQRHSDVCSVESLSHTHNALLHTPLCLFFFFGALLSRFHLKCGGSQWEHDQTSPENKHVSVQENRRSLNLVKPSITESRESSTAIWYGCSFSYRPAFYVFLMATASETERAIL